ncbi:MAG: zinc ribbon domain-containing protein [Ruminococcaceae bacterium]|nr:zinc ribbon domain-containing protein [Oscillospiraceae bacterium]
MICKFCGKEIPNNAQFCSYCGANAAHEPTAGNRNALGKIGENRIYSQTPENKNADSSVHKRWAEIVAAINLLVFWPGTILHFVLSFLGNWNPKKTTTMYKASYIIGALCAAVGVFLLVGALTSKGIDELLSLSIIGMAYDLGF